MKNRKRTPVLLSGIVFTVFCTMKTFAGTPVVTETAGEGILIRFPPFVEEYGEPDMPPETYRWKGEQYERVSSRLVTAFTEEVKRTEKKSITYSDVEQLDHVPEETLITATDEETGVTAKEALPARDVDFQEGRWIDGFQFPITVENYEAGVYDLSGTIITCGEAEPFSGYEEQLLELIGASPEYYEISSTFWTSEPEEDGEGGMIRKAMASGRKYVADCRVTYEGPVVFPAVPALAYEAEYRKIREDPVVLAADSGEEELPESFAEQISEIGRLGRLVTLTTVTVSFLFLVLLLLFLFRLRKKKRQT